MGFANNETVTISDTLFERLQHAYGNRENKPTTIYEFKKFYTGLLKHVFGNLDMITVTREMEKGKRERRYGINDELVKQYLELAKYNDTQYEHFEKTLLAKYNILIPQATNIENNERKQSYIHTKQARTEYLFCPK